jgi:hypothetical protein
MKRAVLSVILLPALLIAQENPKDIWEKFKYFVGTWDGTGQGQPGVSNTHREYQFVLNGRFLQVQHNAVYKPQEKNPKGETHSDWGLISYDRGRKVFVLRQFHIEGFVNQYVLTEASADGKILVFTTESIENIPAGWRARETYRILSPDEFVEVFELAAPGKEFELYSESRHRRKK